MKYRIVKSKWKDGYVYECQEKIMGNFLLVYESKEKPSWLDLWDGSNREPAIFKSFEKAKAFIEKNASSKEVVFEIDTKKKQ